MLRREAERLGYRSTFTIYDDQDQVRLVKACLEELGKDPKRFSPRGIHAQISRAKNELVVAGGVRGARRVVLGSDRRRGVRAVPAAPARLERGRLRRPAHAHGAGLRALPRGARALAQGVPLRPRRRVPGHEPRAVPAPAAPRRRARERLRGRRPGPVDLRVPRRGHPQHPRVRARLPRHAGRSRSSRTTARRTRSSAPPTRSSSRTRERKPKRLFSDLGEGDPVRAIEVEDEHAEARFVAAEIASLIEGGFSGERDRGLLPDERAVAGAGGRARPAGRRRTRSSAGRASTSAPRSATRPRTCSVLVNPQDATSLLRIANRPRRGIGDTSLAAARRARGEHGPHALPGDGRSRGGGRHRGVVPRDPRLPRDDGVAHGALAGAPRRRAPRARAREDRHARRARGRADDRGARADREPPGARRRRARVPAAGGGAVARRRSCRTSRSSPTRTRSATSAASSR